jgi:hypothetical protein
MVRRVGRYDQHRVHVAGVFPSVGTVLFNIATIRLKKGMLLEAQILLRRSLAIAEKNLEPGSADIAETRRYLAVSLRDQKRYADAEAMFRRAIRDLEQAGTGGQAALVTALGDYGVLLRRTGRPAEAQKTENRARHLEHCALTPPRERPRRIAFVAQCHASQREGPPSPCCPFLRVFQRMVRAEPARGFPPDGRSEGRPGEARKPGQ